MREAKNIFRNHLSGAPLAEKKIEEIRMAAQENMKPAQENRELFDCLSQIDFELLNILMKDLLRKSGVTDHTTLDLKAENIFQAQSGTARGEFNAIAGTININFQNIQRLRLNPAERQFVVLKTIIHEYLHALNFQRIDYDVDNDSVIRTHLGLARDNDKPTLVSLEEGFNEILTKMIMDKYIVAVGSGVKEYDETYKKLHDEHNIFYQQEVATVNKLIALLSMKTGVPEETIKEALLREKFNGENPYNIWQSLFIELLGTKHGESLSNLLKNAHPENAQTSQELYDALTQIVAGKNPTIKSPLARAIDAIFA